MCICKKVRTRFAMATSISHVLTCSVIARFREHLFRIAFTNVGRIRHGRDPTWEVNTRGAQRAERKGIAVRRVQKWLNPVCDPARPLSSFCILSCLVSLPAGVHPLVLLFQINYFFFPIIPCRFYCCFVFFRLGFVSLPRFWELLVAQS